MSLGSEHTETQPGSREQCVLKLRVSVRGIWGRNWQNLKVKTLFRSDQIAFRSPFMVYADPG